VQHLTLPEAKQLLGRFRDRKAADSLSQGFQRLATPSRQKLLRGLRNRLPSEIEGKRLGTLNTGSGPTAASTPLVAAAEIVSSTQEPGSFAGFDDATAARQAALRRPTISALAPELTASSRTPSSSPRSTASWPDTTRRQHRIGTASRAAFSDGPPVELLRTHHTGAGDA
jgi:hypothetical protein